METQLEFNPVKILKLINKDSLLKSVYNEDNEPFDLKALTTQAVAETLSDSTLGSLKSIFDDVICNRDTYIEDYLKLDDADKIPRRYGKTQILKELKEQDGTRTVLQTGMLSLNELKSAYINLQGKGTSDRYKGTEKLSEKEWKAINAAIRTFIKSVKPMLNRRR